MTHNHPMHMHRARSGKVTLKSRIRMSVSKRNRDVTKPVTLPKPPWMKKKEPRQ